MRDLDKILANINTEKANRIKFMFRHRLIEDKELNKIDPNLVDEPKLKRQTMCPYCIDQPMDYDKDKFKIQCVKCKNENHKLAIPDWLLKRVLEAMSHYHGIIFSEPRRIEQDGIPSYELKGARVKYTKDDFYYARMERGQMGQFRGRPMVGVILKHGKKVRYLLDRKMLETLKQHVAQTQKQEMVEGFVV